MIYLVTNQQKLFESEFYSLMTVEDSIKDMQLIVDNLYDKSKNKHSLEVLDKIVSDIKEEQSNV